MPQGGSQEGFPADPNPSHPSTQPPGACVCGCSWGEGDLASLHLTPSMLTVAPSPVS